MAIGKEFIELEKVIGYKFSDINLLEIALTHSSYSNEKKSQGINFQSNERLEFLGDSVLEIVISERLFEKYTSRDEGVLTKLRQYLVCEKTLAKIAAEINLGDYLNLGKGEEISGCRTRPKVLCDTLEALFAAIYIDSSHTLSAPREVILRLFDKKISEASEMQRGDYKTMLQQLVEKEGDALLEYSVVEETGPEHDKTFRVVCRVNNNIVGEGISTSKKDAEMKAAMVALKLFGVVI